MSDSVALLEADERGLERAAQNLGIMLKLSDSWAVFFRTNPETGMGYTVVSAILTDGRRFDRVCVVGGIITSVDGSEVIPFSEADVTRFIVTHDKKNLKKIQT